MTFLTVDELHQRDVRRDRLRTLVIVCAVALALVGLGRSEVSDTDIAGASGSQSFDEWYAQPENRDYYHFQQWYGGDVRNSSYYHVRQHFGTGRLGDQAVRVAICESDLNPRAKSPTDDHGVMQLNAPSHRRQFERVTGVAWSPNVYHADANARYARWLVSEQGWGPWTCAREMGIR